MPVRGESVGTAYVRILADGTGLPESIENEIRQTEPGIRAAGKRNSAAYAEEFAKGLNKPGEKKIVEALNKAIARGDLAADFFESGKWERFVKRLRKEFGDAGVLAASELQKEFVFKGDLKGFDRAIGDITSRVQAARLKIADVEAKDLAAVEKFVKERERLGRLQLLIEADQKEEFARITEKANADFEKFIAERERLGRLQLLHEQDQKDEFIRITKQTQDAFEKAVRERERLGTLQLINEDKQKQEFLRIVRTREDEVLKQMRKFNVSWKRLLEERGSDYKKQARLIIRETDRIRAEFPHLFDTADSEMGRFGASLDRVRKHLHKANLAKEFERISNASHRLDNRMLRLARTFERTGGILGTTFGRGSRNNFLNFVGSVVRNINVAIAGIIRGISRLTTFVAGAFISMADSVLSFAKTLREEGFKAAIGGLTTSFQGLGTTIATGGLNIVAGLGALAVAFGLAGAFAGALTSALLLLTGVIVALAATIEATLIAAFGALMPLILPVAATILGIVVAVKELKNATGPLKKSVDDLKDAGGVLKDVFADALLKDAAKQTDLLVKALNKMKPAAKNIGTALNNAFKGFVQGLDSPAFNKFLDAFGGTEGKKGFIAVAIESLGRSFTNLLAGMGNLFRGMIPIAREFLGWLEKITGNFAKFGDTPKEQKEIKAFFAEMGESAKALGDFLGTAFGLLQDILNAGRDTGDSIFQSMADALERARTFFKENPDSLTNFFGDVEGFAQDLGFLITKIKDAIDVLDTPKTRRQAGQLVRALGAIIDGFAALLSTLTDVGFAFIKTFFIMAQAVLEFVDASLTSLGFLGDAFPPLGFVVDGIKGKFDDFKDRTLDNFSQMETGIDGVREALDDIQNFSLDLDTSKATAKVKGLQALLNGLKLPTAGELGITPDMQVPKPPTGPGGVPDNFTRSLSTGGKTVNATINVVSPQTDPYAVANEIVNSLVAVGY